LQREASQSVKDTVKFAKSRSTRPSSSASAPICVQSEHTTGGPPSRELVVGPRKAASSTGEKTPEKDRAARIESRKAAARAGSGTLEASAKVCRAIR
jgi:hypothetical protein